MFTEGFVYNSLETFLNSNGLVVLYAAVIRLTRSVALSLKLRDDKKGTGSLNLKALQVDTV
ncbi:hypothetical protein BpHYR1_027930 [Brachionus plicatilis]|uniref:Uncharacterized protein n=1 Tax=Brachionus plicatilis TaxID=10195 RepID=A0A3M7PWZ5_BRAPC|nr:hypothetical protein BpHYR1_027930 [Brachionus plicatilis]